MEREIGVVICEKCGMNPVVDGEDYCVQCMLVLANKLAASDVIEVAAIEDKNRVRLYHR